MRYVTYTHNYLDYHYYCSLVRHNDNLQYIGLGFVCAI